MLRSLEPPSYLRPSLEPTGSLLSSQEPSSSLSPSLEPAISLHRTFEPPNSDRLCLEPSSSPVPLWDDLPPSRTSTTKLLPSHPRAAELPPAQSPEAAELPPSESRADEFPFISPWRLEVIELPRRQPSSFRPRMKPLSSLRHMDAELPPSQPGTDELPQTSGSWKCF